MERKIIRNQKVRLEDIAEIFTKEKIENRVSSGGKKDLRLFIPKQVHNENLCVKLVEGLSDEDGFYVLLKKDYKSVFRADYIAYQLSSLAGGLKLLYDTEKQRYKTRILLNVLKDYSICCESVEAQYYYAISERLVSILSEIVETTEEMECEEFAVSYRYKVNFYKEIRDALSLEQELKPLFKEYGISIFKHWVGIVDKSRESTNKDFEKAIFAEATSTKNELYNNIKKMRLLISNITKLILNNEL